MSSLKTDSTSSLVELYLDMDMYFDMDMDMDPPNFSAARFLDSVSNFTSLKKLFILFNFNENSERENEEMTLSFLKLLGMLPNLEDLYMRGLFASVKIICTLTNYCYFIYTLS